jgi:hypothetical protein
MRKKKGSAGNNPAAPGNVIEGIGRWKSGVTKAVRTEGP